MNKGGRNLIILGIGAIVIATALSSISLVIYHTSGDIYIDRSRPGFLPDEEELEENTKTEKTDFVFAEAGAVNQAALDEYLEKLEAELKELEKFTDPFDMKALSDETLGID